METKAKRINQKIGEISRMKEYLNSTDYMILKAYETEYECPAEVLSLRQAARDNINTLQLEISAIEAEPEEETPDTNFNIENQKLP